MQEELRALIERHCATLGTEAAAVRACLGRLDDPTADATSVIAEGADLAHKIKGSSGSIGFREISQAAQTLEYCLRALCESEAAPTGRELDKARTLATDLEERVAAITPEQSMLYNAT